MSGYCAYRGCTQRHLPCSKIPFFTIPKDNRRNIWIENSGNPLLQNISPTALRSFCINHFDPKDLRRSFHRTILSKTAIPYKFDRNRSSLTYKHINEIEGLIVEETEKEETAQENNIEFEEDDVGSMYLELEPEESVEVEKPIEKPLKNGSNHDDQNDFYIEDDFTDNSILSLVEDNENQEEIDSDFENQIEHNLKMREQETSNSKIAEPDKPNKQTISDEDRSLNYDQDKHFALSLIGYIQKLSPRTRSLAKLKILQYLTELEINDKSDVL